MLFRSWAKEFLGSLPGDMVHWAQKAEESLKVFFSPGLLFEALNFKYVGPVQGHRVEVLLETFENVKKMVRKGDGPVLVHALTAKGYGYEPAQRDPFKYHGVGAFEVESGRFRPSKPGPPKYQNVFADALIALAEDDERIVGITAAMKDGTGLDRFEQAYPDRFYDVGIAEQHAVTFAAGLACEGLKPVVAIYSTFLQRGYDQLVHDVALQNLPVMFALDRAGLVGADGATHAGSYDYAFLRCIPNMVVLAPSDENECRQMLYTAFRHEGPSAVRYPRGAGVGVQAKKDLTEIPFGKAQTRRSGKRIAILAFGTMLGPCLQAGEALDATVVNMRWVKPLDTDLIAELAGTHTALVTVEEHVVMAGAGSAVAEALTALGVIIPMLQLGLPDRFVDHGDQAQLLSSLGLDAGGIERSIRERFADLLAGGAPRLVSTRKGA